MEIVVAHSEKFISITVIPKTENSLSWETLQSVKDRFYSNLDFIEVYPKEKEIVNKANVRHLIHIKEFNCPKLKDLEVESEIFHYDI